MTVLWLLILTATGGYSGDTPAITQVGPFTSELACMSAAGAWLKQAEQINRRARALCVAQSEQRK